MHGDGSDTVAPPRARQSVPRVPPPRETAPAQRPAGPAPRHRARLRAESRCESRAVSRARVAGRVAGRVACTLNSRAAGAASVGPLGPDHGGGGRRRTDGGSRRAPLELVGRPRFRPSPPDGNADLAPPVACADDAGSVEGSLKRQTTARHAPRVFILPRAYVGEDRAAAGGLRYYSETCASVVDPPWLVLAGCKRVVSKCGWVVSRSILLALVCGRLGRAMRFRER
jgi:hypothetical protein